MTGTPRKICVVTGTRAEYGLLYWVLDAIRAEPALRLQIVATGMHLSPEFGLTYKVIEADGFQIDAKVEMLLSGDSPVAIGKSIGLATIGFADAFAQLEPDLVMVLGDRFELLAAAQAALVARIPLAHIAGGDTTQGAYDEAIRHSITKMAHVHFVTNAPAATRVRQLGEDPAHVHLVGSPGLDYVRQVKKLSRAELASRLGYPFRKQNFLVTFHPVTLEQRSSQQQFAEVLAAFERFPEVGIIFTMPNADNDGRIIMRMIEEFVAASGGRAVASTSMGQLLYLSTIAQVDAVIGNSSSGLYEVPSFGKPTVNIGDRQAGRLRAASVIDCQVERGAIVQAIQQALATDFTGTVNPYGDGHSAARIVSILKQMPSYSSLLMKRFHDLKEA